MGFPAPDLEFRNDTPYGILIWTSYTDTSLTVTLYSSPHATAEQTDLSESQSGSCKVVTTTRTRTFPDGHTEQRSEEHTSELQSLMRIAYAVFCLQKKKHKSSNPVNPAETAINHHQNKNKN